MVTSHKDEAVVVINEMDLSEARGLLLWFRLDDVSKREHETQIDCNVQLLYEHRRAPVTR